MENGGVIGLRAIFGGALKFFSNSYNRFYNIDISINFYFFFLSQIITFFSYIDMVFCIIAFLIILIISSDVYSLVVI